MTKIEAVNLAIAMTGAVLGIANSAWQVRQAKVRLKVIPKAAVKVRPDTYQSTTGALDTPENEFIRTHLDHWAITVINTGAIAVTLDEVGFGRRRSSDRGIAFQPPTSSGKKLPLRLEPRDSEVFYCMHDPNGGEDACKHLCTGWAYVETACDLVFQGTSKALRSYSRLSRLKNR